MDNDIEICESLIMILEDQIEAAEDGKVFLLPGATIADSIKIWKEKIAKHERTIAALRGK